MNANANDLQKTADALAALEKDLTARADVLRRRSTGARRSAGHARVATEFRRAAEARATRRRAARAGRRRRRESRAAECRRRARTAHALRRRRLPRRRPPGPRYLPTRSILKGNKEAGTLDPAPADPDHPVYDARNQTGERNRSGSDRLAASAEPTRNPRAARRAARDAR